MGSVVWLALLWFRVGVGCLGLLALVYLIAFILGQPGVVVGGWLMVRKGRLHDRK